jgi:hypothetical protein
MFITRRKSKNINVYRAVKRMAEANPRQHYVHYLCTDELVRALERVEVDLSTARAQRLADRIELYQDIKADLIQELDERQLAWNFIQRR